MAEAAITTTSPGKNPKSWQNGTQINSLESHHPGAGTLSAMLL
jgi:hypothetical protein